MNKFIIDGRYADMLAWHGLDIEAVLRKAQLPGDVFKHKTVTMSEENYFRFLDAVGSLMEDPALPIRIATTNKIENFSPPIFASYCSKNADVCVERLARYKRLIGPMVMKVNKAESETTVLFTTEDEINELPQFLVETEFAFLVGMIRRTTREGINPIRIQMRQPVDNEAFNGFFTIKAEKSEENSITFRNADMQIPFISYDDAMWNYFEPELAKRLAELDVDDSTSARVRSALTELLPSGASAIEDVAEKLGLSKRTLQRKLTEENTTFQKQLNSTREMLAIHYIRNTDMNTNDIAFLLGYQEINSFLRAFTIWTGQGISEYRKSVRGNGDD